MRNVRILYKKTGRARFVSHLDITRFMSRAIRRANIPLWHTEGFNPHPYITFALPLSLGFQSDYEVLDIRVIDDDFDIASIPQKLNAVCNEDIKFYESFDAVKKTGEVFAAGYKISFDDGGVLYNPLKALLEKQSLVITKRTKRGGEKQIDIAPDIIKSEVSLSDNNTVLDIVLPAGGSLNINPELLLNLLFETENYYCFDVNRYMIFDKELKPFR